MSPDELGQQYPNRNTEPTPDKRWINEVRDAQRAELQAHINKIHQDYPNKEPFDEEAFYALYGPAEGEGESFGRSERARESLLREYYFEVPEIMTIVEFARQKYGVDVATNE